MADQEDSNHQFGSCEVTAQWSQMFMAPVNIKRVMPRTTCDILRCWNNGGAGVRNKRSWRAMVDCPERKGCSEL